MVEEPPDEAHRHRRGRSDENDVIASRRSNGEVRFRALARDCPPASERKMSHCPARFSANRSERRADLRTHIPAGAVDVHTGGHTPSSIEEEYGLVAVTDDFSECKLRALIHWPSPRRVRQRR